MFSFERPENYKYFIARRSNYVYYYYFSHDPKNKKMDWSKEKLQKFDYNSAIAIIELLYHLDKQKQGYSVYEYGLVPDNVFLSNYQLND